MPCLILGWGDPESPKPVVFYVLKGRWRFFWGRDGKDGEVIANEGDLVNIPTGIFRVDWNVYRQCFHNIAFIMKMAEEYNPDSYEIILETFYFVSFL